MGCSASVPAAPIKQTMEIQAEEFLSVYPADVDVHFTTSAHDEATIRFAAKGIASESGCPATTLPKLFLQAKEKKGDKVAMRVERPVPPLLGKGQPVPPALPADLWKTWTYAEYYDEASLCARGLISLGVQPHDAVAIFGYNSPEWFLSQVSSVMTGAMAAGIYPTDTPEQVAFKGRHSGARVAIVEDEAKLAKFQSQIDNMPKLAAMVCWACDAPEEGKFTRSDGTEVKVVSWDELKKLGEAVPQEELQARIDAQKPGHCCGLIYTSGTTGNPKAVMISHDNIIFDTMSVVSEVPHIWNDGQERILSYLPLSHVAGMLVDIIVPIVSSAVRSGWTTVSFARPYDLKVGSIGDRLRSVKPTMFLGVPRVWEKISEKLKAMGAQTTGLKKKIATWAKAKGLEYQNNCQLGGSGEKPKSYARAEKVVLSKIKAALGLSECKFGFTGAAPIQKDTLEYFGSLGIQINEVYGMSECCGATTWSTDDAHVWGSCGYTMSGAEIKVFKVNPDDVNDKKECPLAKDIFNPSEEEEGEICFRGRHIMMGYLANPELGEEHVATIEKKNRDAIDSDGWLHSGDKGCMGANGMLKITGRYKELIIGAGGENIAPVPIEDAVKKLLPAVSNFTMIGDKRKFNIALVSVLAKGATGELPGSNELDGAALKVSDAKTITQAMDDEKWAAYIRDAIMEVNKNVPNNASKIQRFTILPRDFSVETGELTPTLKLKRSVVQKKHLEMINKVYEADRSATYVPYDLKLFPDDLDVAEEEAGATGEATKEEEEKAAAEEAPKEE